MKNKEYFLNLGAGIEGPFLTVKADDVKDAPLWWQLKGLTYTSTGYGSKIPTTMMIKYDGRWRRVYRYTYSNIGSLFVMIRGEKINVTEY